MLNIFPALLNYRLVAPVILRAGLGLALVHEGYALRRENALLAVIKFATGCLLIFGYVTQVAAVVVILLTLSDLWQVSKQPSNHDQLLFKLAIAVALLFLGPGFFSFDLPL